MDYEEYCKKRLAEGCRPVDKINWQTRMSNDEIVKFAMESMR